MNFMSLIWLLHHSFASTAWAPEGREGRSQAGPKGCKLEVGPQRSLWLLLLHISFFLSLLTATNASKPDFGLKFLPAAGSVMMRNSAQMLINQILHNGRWQKILVGLAAVAFLFTLRWVCALLLSVFLSILVSFKVFESCQVCQILQKVLEWFLGLDIFAFCLKV